MFNKKAFSVAKYLKSYIMHVGIPDIVQCNNGKEFKGSALIFLKTNRVKLINERPQTFCTQRLVEQANRVMKNKINKKIEATRNHH